MKQVKVYSTLFAIALFLCAMSTAAWGQTADTGALAGAVTDPTGAVVPGVEITVTNEATGAARTVVSGANGFYRVPLLPPGTYRIDATKSGFKQATRSGIVVVVSETATQNLPLALGQSNQTVTVSATTQLIQTESSALGRSVSGQYLLSMPLSNRNYTQVLGLSPGVDVELPNAGAVGSNSQNVSSNGAHTTFNNFEFNGVNALDIAQNAASAGVPIPAPDTIQEFKAQTGLYDASEGYGAGANVDIVGRSGTNSLHGTLWEFLRNTDLNANDFFLKRAGQPRPVLKQNQFGFTLGGPIRRNKDFFFVAYQGTTQRNGLSGGGFSTALLPAALTNDRSAKTLGAEFAGQTGLFGGVPIAPDGSNINPVALNLLNLKFGNGAYVIPTPQRVASGVGQFSYSSPVKYREDQYTGNLDHYFSSRNQLTERFFYAKAPLTAPFTVRAANVPGWGNTSTLKNVVAVLSDTATLSSNLVNVARVGYVRFDNSTNTNESVTNAQAGITPPTGLSAIPLTIVSGLFTIGAPSSTTTSVTNSYVAEDTLSLLEGKHSLRFGAQANYAQLNLNGITYNNGLIQFLSFPDFLLGMSSAQNGTPFSNIFFNEVLTGSTAKSERYTNIAGYAQDDYKVSSRLTLNLGLRYEYFGPPSDTRGRLGNFDPALANPVPAATGDLTGVVVPSNYHGPLPAGVTKTSYPGLWKRDYKDLAPRFGFALRLLDNPGLVLRGGYGIYYQRLSGQVALQTVSNQPFSLYSVGVGPTIAAATFQDPFNPPPPPNSAFPIFIPRTPFTALSASGNSTSLATPYMQQYGLNIEDEFAPNYLLEVGYVGTRGTHLPGEIVFDQAEIASPAHPVHGITTTTAANVNQRAPILGISPQGGYEIVSPFTSNYNSLQASVTKRMSYGLQFLASYTWSKSLDVLSGGYGSLGGNNAGAEFEDGFFTNDQTNPKQAYGASDFNRTNRFVLSLVYQTPKVHYGARPLRVLLSQWQASGVATWQSGSPITVLDSSGGTAYGALFIRAECTGANPASSGSVFNRVNGWLNPAAFTSIPVIGDDGFATGFGNCGRSILHGPDQRNIDLALEKIFPVVKSSNLIFRAEFFNLTNHTNFDLPDSDRSTGPAFGLITDDVTNPRIVQFALKYQF